ncbi:MAG: universal stress protein [Polyangiales bacterium]
MPSIHHILVATDFGEPAERALEYGLMLAKAFDAKVTLFHAFYVPPITSGDGMYVPLPIDQWINDAQKTLDAAVAKAKETWPRVEGVLAVGEPRAATLDEVSAKKPDLVVIGTHGRRGLSRMFLGSVAERVVRTSPAPVLTIHAD